MLKRHFQNLVIMSLRKKFGNNWGFRSRYEITSSFLNISLWLLNAVSDIQTTILFFYNGLAYAVIYRISACCAEKLEAVS
jgi:hypothetical protein